jgi:hypothetical protein
MQNLVNQNILKIFKKLLTNEKMGSVIHIKFEYHKMTVTRTVGL